MSWPRVSIAGSMGVVALFAVAIAGLAIADETWGFAAALCAKLFLLVAVLGVILCRGVRRASWIGVLVFGGGYAISAFGAVAPDRVVLPPAFFESLRNWIHPARTTYNYVVSDSYQVNHTFKTRNEVSAFFREMQTHWKKVMSGGRGQPLYDVHESDGTEVAVGLTRAEAQALVAKLKQKFPDPLLVPQIVNTRLLLADPATLTVTKTTQTTGSVDADAFQSAGQAICTVLMSLIGAIVARWMWIGEKRRRQASAVGPALPDGPHGHSFEEEAL